MVRCRYVIGTLLVRYWYVIGTLLVRYWYVIATLSLRYRYVIGRRSGLDRGCPIYGAPPSELLHLPGSFSSAENTASSVVMWRCVVVLVLGVVLGILRAWLDGGLWTRIDDEAPADAASHGISECLETDLGR